MFKNYLKIAIRNIARHKLYSSINIAGLSISLAIVILIASYAQVELSINKFHKNYNRIYKIGKGPTPATIGEIIKMNVPEIKKAARIETFRTTSVTMKYDNNNPLIVKNIIFSDPDFFDIFTFPAIKGNLKTALTEPMSLVLTETEAKRIFGNEDPIDRTIKLDNKYDLTVKAIMKDISRNSSMQFSGVISFISIKNMRSNSFGWRCSNYETYLLSPKKFNKADLQKKIEPILKQNIPKDHKDLNIEIFSLEDIYYNAEVWTFNSHGSIEERFTLISIAALILLIAVINFINLSTARASMRTKEMGVRKTIGASRFTLVKQFLSESIVISIISMLFAVLIAEELMPIFSELVDLRLIVFPKFFSMRIIILIAAAILLGIFAGIYPAFYLSSFKPGLILRGEIHQGRGKAYLRKALIIFQFSIAVVLIVSTLVIYMQTEYIRNKPLGFLKENIIYFPINKQISSKKELFKTKMLQHSAVTDFAYTHAVPGEMQMTWETTLNYEGKELNVRFIAVPVTSDFTRLMDMKLIEGRNFIDKDENDEYNIIINEAFVRQNGLEKPFEARLTGWGEGKGNVVGIVKDFNFQSLHSEVQPLVFWNIPGFYKRGLIKIKSSRYSDIKGVIENLKLVWKETSPDFPIEYNFLDEKLDLQYKAEEKFEKAFIGFSLFAILIGCLGLFGLYSFTTEQRTKEIGIRKVLGASISGIIIMLSRQFILLVLISNIIAWPIAYYITNNWLQDFAYRIDINWWVFLLAGGIALVIALATVSFQAIKAATTNPVESLRYE